MLRALQPFQRVIKGEVETIQLHPPKQPNEQAAILLQALLPGSEGEKCSTCKSNAGTGPFAECITRGGNWAGGACMNCWYTGRSAKCTHYKGKHSLVVVPEHH